MQKVSLCGVVRVLLVFLISLANAQRFVVNRLDKGDIFAWYDPVGENIRVTCEDFSDHTAWQSDGRCHCDNKLTFSTENNKCQSYKDQVFYRFDEDGSYTNPVICVYVECDHNVCIFKSVLTNNPLPIAVSSSVLHSDDSCRANFVEIIHDCMPRRVDLDLIFASNGNNELYLQLKNVTTPLNYFDGELFKVDVTCDGIEGGAHKKLMFKYNGTRILTNKGSFKNIPAYDPTKICSVVTTSTSTKTLSTSIAPPSPGKKGNDHHSEPIAIFIGIPTIVAVLVVIVACCLKHVREKRRRPRAG